VIPRQPEVGIPEVRFEHIHRVAKSPGSCRDLFPELAFPEQLAARTPVGRQVGSPDQPGGGTDRGAIRMLVEK
jgi:hypothetical protein